jgi:alanyl-tRNA synthetase
VLRRAFRFGYQCFGQREPFICKLVPALVAHMCGAYAELKTNSRRVQDIIGSEEADFLRTIERGLALFEKAATQAQRSGGRIGADDVFNLHTTYGFPPDLTRQMATERSLTLDEQGYEELMDHHVLKSRYTVKVYTHQVALNVKEPLPDTDDRPKWSGNECEAKVLGWIRNNQFFSTGNLGLTDDTVGDALILDRTCFYAEAGGQVGDKGTIKTPTAEFDVHRTYKLGKTVAHLGMLFEGVIQVGQTATLLVNEEREFTRKNHTATHLMNWALRKVLGNHVDQKGSLLDAEKTRFDFTHDKPLSPEEIAEVERLVNEKIYADLPVTPVVMPLAEAKKIPGVRAVFGEKYPDPVRVLLIGATKPEDVTEENSVEFCGGTHLNHTGQAGFFKIVSQELVGKGVRRVTAVTGREAVATVQRVSSVLDDLASRFNCKPEEVPARVESLQEELKKLQIQMRKGAAGDATSAADKLLADARDMGGVKVIVGEMPAAPVEQMRTQMDRLRQKARSCAVLLGWVDDGKVGLLAAMTDDAIKKGLEAGKLVGEVAKVVGGKGGGRKEMAQAGGADPSKLPEALALARKLIGEKLGA